MPTLTDRWSIIAYLHAPFADEPCHCDQISISRFLISHFHSLEQDGHKYCSSRSINDTMDKFCKQIANWTNEIPLTGVNWMQRSAGSNLFRRFSKRYGCLHLAGIRDSGFEWNNQSDRTSKSLKLRRRVNAPKDNRGRGRSVIFTACVCLSERQNDRSCLIVALLFAFTRTDLLRRFQGIETRPELRYIVRSQTEFRWWVYVEK